MKTILRLFWGLLPLWAAAQAPLPTARHTLSGYVREAASGEALIGVSIYVRELATGTTTNTYGFYSLTLPAARYTLRYTFVGFTAQERVLDLSSGDVSLNLELQEEGRALQEVVITASPADENVRSVEMSVNKIDIRTIRQIPALLGEVDLVRSIQYLPGVSTVGEGASGFNVRGGDVGQNLILLDEAPVYNASHLFGFFSVFNPDAVKEVKLIKGGIPANYGGRVSSILDVRMKEGNAKKPELSGGIGLIFSRLTYERPLFRGRGSFIVAGRRSYADVLAQPFLKGDLKGTIFNFYDLTAKVNFQPNERNTFFLSGYFGKDNFGAPAFAFRWGNGTLTARWNHVFSNRLFLNATAYHSRYTYALGSDKRNPRDSFNWNSQIVSRSGKADLTYFITPQNQLSFGGQYIHYTTQPGRAIGVSAGEVSNISLEDRTADESALYVSNEQKAGRWLTLQYGLRYSFYRSLGPGEVITYADAQTGDRRPVLGIRRQEGGTLARYGNWEPRFSANVRFSPQASVKLSYNRMAQYLHLLSNTAAASPLDVWTLSSANLRPQQTDQFALGFFRNFRENSYEASVELFYKKLDNQIDYVRRSDLLLNRFLEGDLLFGKGRAYGMEWFVKKNAGRATGWVSYTLSRTERLVAGINNNAWFPARFDKTHVINVVALYEASPRWNLSASVQASSGTPGTYPTTRYEWQGNAIPNNTADTRNASRIPWYHRLDLSATRQARRRLFKRGQAEWVYSLYNIYSRSNPYSVYVRQNEANNLKTEAVRFAVIGTIIPSVSYNFKF